MRRVTFEALSAGFLSVLITAGRASGASIMTLGLVQRRASAGVLAKQMES
jgi:hypothetical protein